MCDALSYKSCSVCRELVSIMRFPKHETDLLEASQLDYYTGAFWWAKEQGYNVTKISALYTAAHTLLLNVKGNLLLSQSYFCIGKFRLSVMIAQWENKCILLSVIPVTRVQFLAVAEYLKGFFPG